MATIVTAPGFVSPMLVSRGPLPSGPGFAYEVKWDGIRGQVALLGGTVTARSRPGRDCSESFSASQPGVSAGGARSHSSPRSATLQPPSTWRSGGASATGPV